MKTTHEIHKCFLSAASCAAVVRERNHEGSRGTLYRWFRASRKTGTGQKSFRRNFCHANYHWRLIIRERVAGKLAPLSVKPFNSRQMKAVKSFSHGQFVMCKRVFIFLQIVPSCGDKLQLIHAFLAGYSQHVQERYLRWMNTVHRTLQHVGDGRKFNCQQFGVSTAAAVR